MKRPRGLVQEYDLVEFPIEVPELEIVAGYTGCISFLEERGETPLATVELDPEHYEGTDISCVREIELKRGQEPPFRITGGATFKRTNIDQFNWCPDDASEVEVGQFRVEKTN